MLPVDLTNFSLILKLSGSSLDYGTRIFSFFSFLKVRNRQMHDKKSVIVRMRALPVLNSCSSTVACMLAYWELPVLPSGSCLCYLVEPPLRLFNCLCGLLIKSLCLSHLIQPVAESFVTQLYSSSSWQLESVLCQPTESLSQQQRLTSLQCCSVY